MAIDWKDPVVVMRMARASLNMLHIMGGIYIWEFTTTLGFEWELITRKRPWRHSLILYFTARYGGLIALIASFVAYDSFTDPNCAAWTRVCYAVGHAALAAVSCLILLRCIAIWARNPWVTVPLVVMTLGQLGILFYGVSIVQGVWLPQVNSCVLLNISRSIINTWTTFASDFILLVASLVGIAIQGTHGSRLSNLLFTQGVWHIFAAMIAYLPASILPTLNLNDPWNIFFTPPSLVTSVIAATRMHRQLLDVATVPKVYQGSVGPSLNRGMFVNVRSEAHAHSDVEGTTMGHDKIVPLQVFEGDTYNSSPSRTRTAAPSAY